MGCEHRLSTSGVTPDGCFRSLLHNLNMHWTTHLRRSSDNRRGVVETFFEGDWYRPLVYRV
jgi:hypothetical protein